MFDYKSPGGKVIPGMNDQIVELRNQLAQLQAGQGQKNQFGAAQQPQWQDPDPFKIIPGGA
jgi:hypothetical protein